MKSRIVYLTRNTNECDLINNEKYHNMTKLVCFAGAGGTGKTSLANGVKELLPNVEIHRSVVREFYAKCGVATETAFQAKPPEWRKGFQNELLEYYITELTDALQRSKADYLVCERSVFDHIAYTIYGSRELYDTEMHNLATRRIHWFAKLKPLVIYLPYPTPWDHLAADGFRDRSMAKDLIIDALIKTMLQSHADIVTYTETPTMPLGDRVRLTAKLMAIPRGNV